MKSARRKRKGIPVSFKPRFWEDSSSPFRRKVLARLKEYRDALRISPDDDPHKHDLLERAVFIVIRLETLEIEADEDGKLDQGVYTQMVNCFQGILKTLGLERPSKASKKHGPKNLRAYLGRQA